MSRSAIVSVVLFFSLVAFEAADARQISGQIHHEVDPIVATKILQPYYNHSLHYGKHTPDEVVLYQVVLSSENNKTDAHFPDVHGNNEPVISAIEIIDKIANGKSGFVYNYAGGVGSTVVHFHYHDNQKNAYKFDITVFGRK